MIFAIDIDIRVRFFDDKTPKDEQQALQSFCAKSWMRPGVYEGEVIKTDAPMGGWIVSVQRLSIVKTVDLID